MGSPLQNKKEQQSRMLNPITLKIMQERLCHYRCGYSYPITR